MSSVEQAASVLREAFDTVEEAYEFMLAYAAQGRQTESETEGASQIRGFLDRFRSALDDMDGAIPQLIPAGSPGHAYAERFIDDSAIMKSILDLLTSRDNITSEMIDNTNGMVPVRSLLTNIFFVDQALLPHRESR